MVISRTGMGTGRKQRFPSPPAAGHRGVEERSWCRGGWGPFPAVLCRRHRPGAPRPRSPRAVEGGRKAAAPRAAPGRAVPGARRCCRGGGAGRSAAPRAAAGSQGREGPAAGDFMGRRRRWRREVGLAFRLPVPSAGRARGGRCAGQRGRGDSGDGKRQLGRDGSAGLTPSPPSPSRPEEDGARLVRACGRSSRSR